MQIAVAHQAERSVPDAWWGYKRTIDLIVACVLLIVTVPIIAVAAIGIVVVTGGSPLYTQERVGQFGKRFKMYKLRTMVENAHELRDQFMHLNESDGPVFKIRNDPRLHPLGGFLRSTSIDELPNLINVLRGEMSLVGPRPALPSEVEFYDEYASRRLLVPQGITCLWQVNGRCELTFDEWMRLDNEYVDTWTPGFDLLLMVSTIPAVLRRNGAH